MMTLGLLDEEGLAGYRSSLVQMGCPAAVELGLEEALAFKEERRGLLLLLRPLEEAQKLAEKAPGREGRRPTDEEREALRSRGGRIQVLREKLAEVEEALERRLAALPPGLDSRLVAGVPWPVEVLGAPVPAFPYVPKGGDRVGERLGIYQGAVGGRSGRSAGLGAGIGTGLGAGIGTGPVKGVDTWPRTGAGTTGPEGLSRHRNDEKKSRGETVISGDGGTSLREGFSGETSLGEASPVPPMGRAAFVPSWEGATGLSAPTVGASMGRNGWQGMGLELLSLLELHLHRALWKEGFFGQDFPFWEGEKVGRRGNVPGKGYLAGAGTFTLWQLVDHGMSGEALQSLGQVLGRILGGLGLPLRLSDLPPEALLGLDCRQALCLEGWAPSRDAYLPLVYLRDRGRAIPTRQRLYRPGGKREAYGLLTGSALPVRALLLLILENGQQDDGGVLLPKALAQGMGEPVLYRR